MLRSSQLTKSNKKGDYIVIYICIIKNIDHTEKKYRSHLQYNLKGKFRKEKRAKLH
jgi:hypothetical protein